ncbi:hypothetical protein VPH35_093538 [Triticum aestivum]|uniref:F-box/FBD/LRR-repeat protein At1g13570 n=1 Tax=Triticum aestivum TaxID=4565 RepID=UPI001D021F78|nr:F-box/FBD/LRR-repeat protein At1g13570-like [Triticum aestivum]
MAGRTPLTNAGAATEADAHKPDVAMVQLRTYICTELLPAFPALNTRRLTALPSSSGIDRISLLPDALLCNIVSRLPVTDAARTAVLASRWRRVWLSAPLALIDEYLRPSGNPPTVTAAVSQILDAHPGPFRFVHLVRSHMDACQPQLARWLELLATKGVQELVLVNRPWPLEVPLPATLFSVTTLTRLYIGIWKFPDVARLQRGTSFPCLRELGVCTILIKDGDIEALVARSPVLEILNIQGSNKGLRLRLVSQSLRCVQICGSVVEDIAVVKAPCLDRLIVEHPRDSARGLCTRVRIGDCPKLHALGILKAGNHILEIQGTVIVAGIKPSPSTMVMNVKILSLNVCFGDHDNIKMLTAFLRCFPNLETLHIMSAKGVYQAGNVRPNLRFWESAKPTKSVEFSIKVISFCEFRGELGEAAFLKFFFRSARALESAMITMRSGSFSTDELSSRVKQVSQKMVSKSCKMIVLGSDGPEGGRPWSFKRGTDYCFKDPFSAVEWVG